MKEDGTLTKTANDDLKAKLMAELESEIDALLKVREAGSV
jgi:hypothetical protein